MLRRTQKKTLWSPTLRPPLPPQSQLQLRLPRRKPRRPPGGGGGAVVRRCVYQSWMLQIMSADQNGAVICVSQLCVTGFMFLYPTENQTTGSSERRRGSRHKPATFCHREEVRDSVTVSSCFTWFSSLHWCPFYVVLLDSSQQNNICVSLYHQCRHRQGVWGWRSWCPGGSILPWHSSLGCTWAAAWGQRRGRRHKPAVFCHRKEVWHYFTVSSISSHSVFYTNWPLKLIFFSISWK